VDYSIADRSKGYAIEDIRFAKIALWSGLIAATQYNDALSRQKAMADRKEQVPHIGRILVDSKAIQESNMEAILEVRCKSRPSADDVDFAKLAMGNNYCTEQQVKECEAIMAQCKRQGRDTPPMACLLLERRYIKENQLLAILKSQQKRRLGIIHDVQVAVEERKPLSVLEKYVGMKGDPKRKYKVAALFSGVGFFVLFYLWWMGVFSSITAYLPTFGGPKIGYFCEGCGTVFLAKEYEKVPITCIGCGKKEAIYGFHCRKCGNFFGVDDRKGTIRCKRCKSDKFEDLTPKLVEEVQAAKVKERKKLRGEE
jgi:DNA-directed RNA polymerase subunit RPC12/RpoP